MSAGNIEQKKTPTLCSYTVFDFASRHALKRTHIRAYLIDTINKQIQSV